MDYKIKYIKDDWVIFQNANMMPVPKWDSFNPMVHKLFNMDIFTYIDGVVRIIHSPVRITPNIPCIMENGIATPDDIRLPPFYIHDIPHSPEYVLISYKNWDIRPIGYIMKRIGITADPRHFFEYFLYSKSLHHIPYVKYDHLLEQMLSVRSYRIEDRRDHRIITIDPRNSRDYDDAFSCIRLNDTIYKLSIYISNVPLWIDFLNLWEAVQYRMEHIHLPDRKRPLFPSAVSDAIMTLKAHSPRIAFCIDLYMTTSQIKAVNYRNVFIVPERNYTYDDMELYDDETFQIALPLIREYHRTHPFKNIDKIHNGHDIIAYLMLLANTTIAKEFIHHKIGLYRAESPTPDVIGVLTPKFRKVYYSWNLAGSCFKPFSSKVKHSYLKLEEYIQITSPIRRLVDFINLLKIQMAFKMVRKTLVVKSFVNYWLKQVEYINSTLKILRRVQTGEHVISRFIKNGRDMYNGYVFDVIQRNDGLYQYMVYIEELDLMARHLSSTIKNNFEVYEFKVYMTENRGGKYKLMVAELKAIV